MKHEPDWTRLEARPIRMVLIGGIAIISVGIIIFLGTEVRQKLNELAYSPADNMQWTLSQFEVEFLELMVALDEAETVPPGTDAERLAGALDNVRMRYDILYSRLDTLANSPLYRQAIYSQMVFERFRETETAIRDMVPLIDGTDAALRDALPEIRAVLDDLRPVVRGILTQGNQVLVENADETRTDVALVLYRLVLASLVLLVALSLLVLIFRRLASINERRAQQVLATSARLETIVSTSRDAILVLDRHGQIETANRAAEAMFDGTDAPLTGRWIGSLLFREHDPKPRPLDAKDLRVLCQEEERSTLRLIGRTQRATFPVEVSMNVTDREGAPVFVCVIRDISHQVEAEAELKESRDRALAGERAKARFLGVVSHEMRTPLNGIIGTITLMEEAPETDLRTQYLPVLRNSAHVLLDLVNDVLDITRIEGDTQVRSAPFDLDQIVASVIASEVPRARANGNRLERSAEPPVGTVLGDMRRFRTVLVNLVANAAKFTRGGEITVTAERLSPDLVEIQVIDTGIGISEADLPTIFDDFVRTDAAVDLQIQGTGLGLGIVRQLVHSMDGEIAVESTAGEGSLFRVILPFPVSAAPAPEAAAPAPAAPVKHPRLGILVVEDNATNRFVTGRMLTNQGHAVIEAHDGLEAVRLAGERPFDLILMDVSMPNMSGVEAARRIRETDGPNRSTLIVALTAHIGEEATASLGAAGLNEVLTKPLTRAALDAIIARAAELQGPHRDAATTPNPVTDDTIPAAPLFDRHYTETLVASNSPERVVAQIDHFITEGNALFQSDPTRARDLPRQIHDFAGLAAVFGASRLHAALAAAEIAARAGDEDALGAAMTQGQSVWCDTRDAAAAYRDRVALGPDVTRH